MKFFAIISLLVIFTDCKSQEIGLSDNFDICLTTNNWKIEMQDEKSDNEEKELVLSFKKINEYHERHKSKNKSDMSDSLLKANEDFKNLLLRHAENPLTLTADFAELRKSGVRIATSDDGLFRIYSWNTELGGSMRIFRNVYQYKSAGKVYSMAVSQGMAIAGSWYSEICSHKASGKTYYLGIGHSILSGKDNRQEIRAFEIVGGALNDAKLIKTKEGLTNRLRVLFDFFSVSKRPERPIKLIQYDESSGVITLPLVDSEYQVTGKSITYKFDGNYFVRK